MTTIKTLTNRAGILCYKPVEKQVDRHEKYEQQDLNSHCEKLWPVEYESMWHTINESGGKSSKQYGAMLNKQGRKKGVADWCVMIPVGNYHGMYLELKRCHSGSISKEQKAFIKRQSELGYFCCVAYGFRAALKAIDDYLTGKCQLSIICGVSLINWDLL